MIRNNEDEKKQIIGLYGELQLAMILHKKGWEVHRSFIDKGIDFVITKYFCTKCKKYTNRLIRNNQYEGEIKKCVTNLCELCETQSLKIISKYLQIKTSEGVYKSKEIIEFSFHPKIRYDIGDDVFYVWIAIFNEENQIQNENQIQSAIMHFYIFNTKDVIKFDNIDLPTYQITDNQKTTLRINTNGEILNKGNKYDYSCFANFHNNFNCLDHIDY